MAITPVNVARVTQNLQAFNLLNTVRGSSLSLFRTQNQLATGLRFMTPSEDPTRAITSLRFDRRLDTLKSVGQNLQSVNATLTAGEAAMQDAVDMIREAYSTALGAVNDTVSGDERRGLVTTINSILDQAVSIGNRKHLDTYLFSGHYGSSAPFELTGDGVLFRGDDGRLQTIVDSDFSQDSFTISGKTFFNAISSAVRGIADLDPTITPETRLKDLRGATGTGVQPGRIMVSDGAVDAEVDLTGCDTVGDVLDRLEAQMPASLQATLTGSSINLSTAGGGPGSILVLDVANGTTAVQLGIVQTARVSTVIGDDLDPLVTQRTALGQLNAGAGVDLSAGITIRNGSQVANISFNGNSTIEDVLNRINQSNVGVLAQINPDGRTIDVLNRISGSDLRIEENGGLAATGLGIRSMHAGVPLSQLNDGRGLETVPGDDFRITTASGATVDVDLDAINLGAATLQDVIDLINAQGGGAITAALANPGNGLVIRDNTVGGGTLTIERLNVSPAIDGLGLDVAASAGQIVGRDVNPVRVDSPFTALLELRGGLESDDTQTISAAAERLHDTLEEMQVVQGQLAAKAHGMLERTERVDTETTATTVMQSDTRDVDLAEAIVRFQQLQTALQANMASAARIMNLSLFNYLR